MDNVLVEHGIGAGLPIKSTTAITVTPNTSNQVLVKGQYLKDITVKGDANLIAANIINGKTIYNVAGKAPAVTTSGLTVGTTIFYGTISGASLTETTTPTKVWEYQIKSITGYISIFCDLYSYNGGEYNTWTAYAYKNGVLVGTICSLSISSSATYYNQGNTSTYVTHGDYVQIYVNATATNGGQITIPHIALATGSAILNP